MQAADFSYVSRPLSASEFEHSRTGTFPLEVSFEPTPKLIEEKEHAV
jgi:hypothetical protein